MNLKIPEKLEHISSNEAVREFYLEFAMCIKHGWKMDSFPWLRMLQS